MDDSVNFLVVENFLYAFAVQHIGFVEGYFLSGNLFYTLDGFLACIVKVVHDNNVIACVQQFHTGVASNISSSAGYQNSHSIYLLINLINSFFIFIFS